MAITRGAPHGPYRSAHTQADLLQQLSLNSVSADSTEQLLRQVLGAIEELKMQQQQQHQHQQKQDALADGSKVR